MTGNRPMVDNLQVIALPTPPRLQRIGSDRTLYKIVYGELYEAIVTGSLAPGEPLREDSIAQELGVSRGPVREALRQLEESGLVVTSHHRGTFVAKISADDLRQICDIRIELEGLAVRKLVVDDLVTPQLIGDLEAICDEMASLPTGDNLTADRRFHDLLYQATGHRRLLKLLDHVRGLHHVYMNVSSELFHIPGKEAAELHRDVIRALCSGDPTVAEQAIQRHVAAVLPLLKDEWSTGAPTTEGHAVAPTRRRSPRTRGRTSS